MIVRHNAKLGKRPKTHRDIAARISVWSVGKRDNCLPHCVCHPSDHLGQLIGMAAASQLVATKAVLRQHLALDKLLSIREQGSSTSIAYNSDTWIAEAYSEITQPNQAVACADLKRATSRLASAPIGSDTRHLSLNRTVLEACSEV